MSKIRAFKAVRPASDKAQLVAALPYDVMNSDEAREMVQGNPYSFLHVDKSEIDLEPGIDLYDASVYAKANENLQKLVADSVLITEGAPCLYIYKLTMNGREQVGLVCCTSVDEYLEGKIKKHELTRKDKEEDRTRHVDITNANTGPIFLTYKHDDKIVSAIGAWMNSNAPVYDFVSEDGIGHEVWVINKSETIAELTKAFGEVECLYIADGHHRNASSVNVALKRRAEQTSGTDASEAEHNFTLSVIFPDNHLHIMDYNRLVKDLNGMTENAFIERISEDFIVEAATDCVKPAMKSTFGMYLRQKGWYLLTAKPHLLNNQNPVDALDVSVLQDALLKPVLNIGDVRVDKRIDFVGGIRGLEELQRRVDSGEMAVAFSMYPTSMDELMNIADAGQIMPPKSTWFEPKLRSGLFIHSLS